MRWCINVLFAQAMGSKPEYFTAIWVKNEWSR